MTQRVLITCIPLQRTIAAHRERLELAGVQIVMPVVTGQHLSESDMLQLVPDVSGIVAGDDVISRPVLERAGSLRVISKWGVGTDNIDIPAATRMGIRVTNTPNVFGDEVADVVIGYLVLLARGLHVVDRDVRAGRWSKPTGTSLAGRVMGIVGLGDIGLEVARRCLAMRMVVVGTDPDARAADAAEAAGVSVMPLRSVLDTADVISLNCPLTAATRNLIGRDSLASMKRGAWLINTARGGLVDEEALALALERNHVAGAALDVFADEPLPESSRLRRLENVILGSHNSSNTSDAVHRTSVRAIDNLLEGLSS